VIVVLITCLGGLLLTKFVELKIVLAASNSWSAFAQSFSTVSVSSVAYTDCKSIITKTRLFSLCLEKDDATAMAYTHRKKKFSVCKCVSILMSMCVCAPLMERFYLCVSSCHCEEVCRVWSDL
jgi:hypothetical protein